MMFSRAILSRLRCILMHATSLMAMSCMFCLYTYTGTRAADECLLHSTLASALMLSHPSSLSCLYAAIPHT